MASGWESLWSASKTKQHKNPHQSHRSWSYCRQKDHRSLWEMAVIKAVCGYWLYFRSSANCFTCMFNHWTTLCSEFYYSPTSQIEKNRVRSAWYPSSHTLHFTFSHFTFHNLTLFLDSKLLTKKLFNPTHVGVKWKFWKHLLDIDLLYLWIYTC